MQFTGQMVINMHGVSTLELSQCSRMGIDPTLQKRIQKSENISQVLVRRRVHLGFYHQHKSLFVLSIRSHEEFQVRKKKK